VFPVSHPGRIATRISGIGAYVPERRVTNDDVLKLLERHSSMYMQDGDFGKLMGKARRKLAKTGSGTRYWCAENQYCTDIAREASIRALADARVSPEEIDLIIFTGMSKAFVEPATAHVLRHELGAVRANVIDTQDACASFMKSIELADALIRSGSYRTVLVAAGERTFDWADFTCKTVYELDWKFSSLTIGDAAGALVLQASAEAAYTRNPRHMRFYYRIEDGSYPICHVGLNYRFGERYRLHSHSSRLIRIGIKVMMELLIERLKEEEWKELRYENLFIHDIGRVIDDRVLPFIREAKLHVPESYRSFFPEYGNVASASLPLGMWLAKRDGRLQRGNLCLFICPAAGVQAGAMIFLY